MCGARCATSGGWRRASRGGSCGAASSARPGWWRSRSVSTWSPAPSTTVYPGTSVVPATSWYLRRAGTAYLAEAAATAYLAEAAATAYLAEAAATAELTDAFTETARGARTVEALGLEEERVRHGTERIGRVWATRRRTLALRSVVYPVVEASCALPIGAVLLVGGQLIAHDVVSLGDVVAAALHLQQAIDPMDRLLQYVEQAQRGLASYARVLGVGQVSPEPAGLAATPAGRRLVVRRVTYSYGDGREVLHGIDLIGSLRDNLAFAAPDAIDVDMRAALAAVNADWYAGLPHGLDTEPGERAHALSIADAQQPALARLVLADPHTLILDEATAALDPTAARKTERALADVLMGRTVIAIAHRLNTAHDADRVAVVEDGRIVELGSHDDLVRAGGPDAALWNSWHGAPRSP